MPVAPRSLCDGCGIELPHLGEAVQYVADTLAVKLEDQWLCGP